MVDLTRFLTGNARWTQGRTPFAETLYRFASENPHGVKISSLDRDRARQTQLWEQALVKYGSPEAARKWVAPPGGSFHEKGGAADLKYANSAARIWAHENAKNYGLAFPLSNENWHVEPVGQRTGKGGAPAAPAPAMQMPAGTNSAPAPNPVGPQAFAQNSGPMTMPELPPQSGFGAGIGDMLAGLMKSGASAATKGNAPAQEDVQPQENGPAQADLGRAMSEMFAPSQAAEKLTPSQTPGAQQGLLQQGPFTMPNIGVDPRTMLQQAPYRPGQQGGIADLLKLL